MPGLRWALAAALALFWAGAAAPQTSEAAEKVALATKYLELTHYGERLNRSWSQQLKLSWSICRDSRCQADLDHDIEVVINAREPAREALTARLLASKVSRDDLRAALSFLQTPSGQAFNRAVLDMNDQLTLDTHKEEVAVVAAVSKLICSQHAEICTAPPSR
jgi:hypothetical protein